MHLTSLAESEIVKNIEEKLCYVALDSYEESNKRRTRSSEDSLFEFVKGNACTN